MVLKLTVSCKFFKFIFSGTKETTMFNATITSCKFIP